MESLSWNVSTYDVIFRKSWVTAGYSLFNDTVSESDNITSNGRIISQHSIENYLKEAAVN